MVMKKQGLFRELEKANLLLKSCMQLLSLLRQMFEFPSGFSALAEKKKKKAKKAKKAQARPRRRRVYIRNAAKPTFCKNKHQ